MNNFESAELITPVILSGGAGSRLWPMSREKLPKQFLPLLNGRTLFDLTLDRVSDVTIFSPPLIVSSANSVDLVSTSLERSSRKGRIILEPLRRDSAAAIAVAVATIMQDNPHRIILVLAADHLVNDQEAFNATIRDSLAAAEKGLIVTFSVTPDSAHTGYGYIRPGANIGYGVQAIQEFIEKPEKSRAEKLLREGCMWNSGNFLFRAATMQAEIERFEPELARVARDAAATLLPYDDNSIQCDLIDAKIFSAAPLKSIDYAVLERTKLGACKAVEYDWSDLGTWESLWKEFEKDEHDNSATGPVSLLETRESLVFSDGPHTVVVGLSHVAVVATRDAVLVAPRDVSNALKTVVTHLKSNNDTQSLAIEHAAEIHRWGSVNTLGKGTNFEIRHLTLKPGKATPVLCHPLYDVQWTVIKGSASAVMGMEQVEINTKTTINIAAATPHSLANDTAADVECIELRTPPAGHT